MASKAIAPKARATPQDQGGTDLCSLFAINKAIVEWLKKSNIHVSPKEVEVALKQLNFVKVKGGHHVTEFDGAKLKILTDKKTGRLYDVTLEIKQHDIDTKLMQHVNKESISCVLDYIQQDHERHCVFIDKVETGPCTQLRPPSDPFLIRWLTQHLGEACLRRLHEPWRPWILWNPWMIPGRKNFICANSWGNLHPNPEIDVHQEGNKVFEVKGTFHCLESGYGSIDVNIAIDLYDRLKWTHWLIVTLFAIFFEIVEDEVIGHWSGGVYLKFLIWAFLTVFISGNAEHCVSKSSSLDNNTKNKTTWTKMKVSVWYIIGVLLRFFIFPLILVLGLKISELVVHEKRVFFAVQFLFLVLFFILVVLLKQQNCNEIPLNWCHQISLGCVLLFVFHQSAKIEKDNLQSSEQMNILSIASPITNV